VGYGDSVPADWPAQTFVMFSIFMALIIMPMQVCPYRCCADYIFHSKGWSHQERLSTVAKRLQCNRPMILGGYISLNLISISFSLNNLLSTWRKHKRKEERLVEC
jgi:hypothetical protein